ncbi:MAG: hypothetical protein R3C44_10970 [Chloroflexota bacterium]
MQQEQLFNRFVGGHASVPSMSASRKTIIGLILIVALLAFEIFNFDTTRFALESLLGEVAFVHISWATILAIAFCAIDFAGLARLFTPERGKDEPKAVWYLMGAWLLGATMNAIMTWWAVSLTLLSHDFGNEVLGREQLLTFVPIFVAALVLLTRVLFIGAFSVAGEHVFDLAGQSDSQQAGARPATARPMPKAATASRTGLRRVPDEESDIEPAQPASQPARNVPTSRNRPPMPSGGQQAPLPCMPRAAAES